MAIINTGVWCLTQSLELLTKSAKSFDLAFKIEKIIQNKKFWLSA
tara:strand:- start:4243 stop:4377 length:135 start_codon:yes stop_codon:yes gene_type:complete